MRLPGVDIPDEGGSQVTDLTELTTLQVMSHVILPVLKENGHPRPHRWAAYKDVLGVAARRDQWQFPSEGCHCLHELRCAQPLGDLRHWEGLLELPVLGALLDCSEYLSRELLGLSAKCQQALNSLVVRGEGAADNRSMPSDVGWGVLHYFLL